MNRQTMLFALTMLVSAFLLFLVQPMIAKMILPLLGGTPSVWNSCMVFFQAALLAGYLYSHVSTRWLGLRRQAVLHVLLMLAALFALPIGVPAGAAASIDWSGEPFFWVVRVLAAAVGLPFFVVATTAPLLQKWFTRTNSDDAGDPYFLYAASNAGSLVALLAYPVVLEPALRLGSQSRLWFYLYGLLVLLIASCAVSVLRSKAGTVRTEEVRAASSPLALARRLRWVMLALVPSSLTLGVTTYFTTDIAPMPLLWVIPLSIYLITFILAFSRRPAPVGRLSRYVLPGLALAAVFLLVTSINRPLWLLAPVHLGLLLVAALVCHGRLAADRPAPEHLTEFYLWVSLGGVLGGTFNALAAPKLFTGVVEYPLMIVLACLLRPGDLGGAPRDRVKDLALPAALFALLAAAAAFGLNRDIPLWVFVVLPFAALVAYGFLDRPLRFALGVAALALAGGLFFAADGNTLHRSRNFFGSVRVTLDEAGARHELYHGSTIHNAQFLDPERRCRPTLYHHPAGPLGRVFEVYNASPAASRRVAVVGLGTGASVAYSQPGQRWTFYEIDPEVVSVANDPAYFTFLRDCAGAPVETVLGDARLRLHEAPEGGYGLIVLDAFSSDVVPVHLLTKEALGLYLSKLDADGIIALHISNRYLDLRPVLGAAAAEFQLDAIVSTDRDVPAADVAEGRIHSLWVVMSKDRPRLDLIAGDGRWRPLAPDGTAAWTDDYSNILSVVKW